MRGDKLVIQKWHQKAGEQIAKMIQGDVAGSQGRFTISIAGESGCGKSEIAQVLAECLDREGIGTYIFGQDDYFKLPPKTNAAKRLEDISWVGTGEVRLDLLDNNLLAFFAGRPEIEKPLIDYDADEITSETADFGQAKVAIAEGTYTSLLENLTKRVFIDRTLDDTREARKLRAREAQDEHLEKVLQIEHEIISKHKSRADIIITKDYEAILNE